MQKSEHMFSVKSFSKEGFIIFVDIRKGNLENNVKHITIPTPVNKSCGLGLVGSNGCSKNHLTPRKYTEKMVMERTQK